MEKVSTSCFTSLDLVQDATVVAIPYLLRKLIMAVAVQYRLIKFLGTSRQKSLLYLSNFEHDHSIWFLHVVLLASSWCLLLTLNAWFSSLDLVMNS